jgi:hypothetical protein
MSKVGLKYEDNFTAFYLTQQDLVDLKPHNHWPYWPPRGDHQRRLVLLGAWCRTYWAIRYRGRGRLRS